MAPPPSHSQAVLPKPETLALERIEKQDCEFKIFISTRQPAMCPVCGQETKSRHSGYSRRLADLPWQGCSVQLWLSLHKWRCAKQNCPRKVFCERIPGVAPVYGRRTERLAAVVGAVGYVAGGLPGARLLERLAIRISDDTVRRQVIRNAHGMHAPEAIRCLGVDDWAWRKHQTYGTIFVDLDRHKVVDLLSDRAAESVAAWLKEHPTVEIIAHDRSGLYADGAATGAPDARQVADRFHLILNLSTAIERVLEERSRELVIPAAIELMGAKPLPLTTPSKLTAQKEQQQQRRQRRLGRYEEVAELHRQGYSKMAISREFAISIKTVRRWLRADQFPERKPPSGRRNKVAEFATYLNERWKAGCHNATQLFTEIRARGYKGSRQMVTLYVASWRPTGDRPSKAASPQRVAPKHAAILTVQAPEKFTPEQQTLFDRLAACCPDLLSIRKIALAFRDVFTVADSAALLSWIENTKRCRFGPLVRFAYGLRKDLAAVTAAVETEWSNGQTEGQINRLKAIKRQMYGRAGFTYLRARVLPCPVPVASAALFP